jgi:uncharacterized protein YggL (DUF469 family)
MAACPVLGFVVQLEPAPGADLDALWTIFEALLASRGLQCVEGGDEPPPLEYLVSSEGGQATELDREALQTWLGARGELSTYGVGPLVDLERDADA